MASIKIRSKRLNGSTQIRTLIAHPMEHGRNRDPKTGELIPAHFIQILTLMLNDNIVMTCNMAGSIAKDPYFAFLLKGGKTGDKITISWVDNHGNTDSAEHFLK